MDRRTDFARCRAVPELHIRCLISSTKDELKKVERFLKLLGVEKICGGANRDEAKIRIAEWINNKLGANIHQYKCIYIIPVIPTGGAKFNPYTILRFVNISDARYFKYVLHKRKANDSTINDIRTIRWSISSADLSAGNNKDYIQAVQEQIVDFYNTHIGNNTTKLLKSYHAKLIRFNMVKVSYKGDQHIVLECLDLCDGVIQMYFKPGTDPFGLHDFNKDIPNPTTRARAEADANYKQCTLKDFGLWAKDKPR